MLSVSVAAAAVSQKTCIYMRMRLHFVVLNVGSTIANEIKGLFRERKNYLEDT